MCKEIAKFTKFTRVKVTLPPVITHPSFLRVIPKEHCDSVLGAYLSLGYTYEESVKVLRPYFK